MPSHGEELPVRRGVGELRAVAPRRDGERGVREQPALERHGRVPAARTASGVRASTTALRASSPLSTFPLSDSTPTVPCSYAGSASDYEGDLLVIPFWQTADDAVVDVGAATTANAWNDELEGLLVDLAAERDFKGAKGSGCLVSVSKKRTGVGKVALYGLGKKDEAEGDAYRGLGAYAAKTAREERAAFVGVAAPSRTRDAWRDVAKVEASWTGRYLKELLERREERRKARVAQLKAKRA